MKLDRYFSGKWRRVRELGFVNALLFMLQRIASRLAPSARVERFAIVSIAIAESDSSPLRRAGNIVVRQLSPGEAVPDTFRRMPGELEDRFDQGAVCLGAFRDNDLLAWIWFAKKMFRDAQYSVCFDMTELDNAAWDFDLYVRPDARLSSVFARLWAAAMSQMSAAGTGATLSAISRFNSASLSSHKRLGAKIIGDVVLLKFGRMFILYASDFSAAPRLQVGFKAGQCGLVRIRRAALGAPGIISS